MKQIARTKRETLVYLSNLPDNNWTTPEVKSLVNNLKQSTALGYEANDCPECVKFGDIWAHKSLKHPMVVIKVNKNKVWSVMLTSTKGSVCEFAPTNSRFLVGNSFTTSISISERQHVLDSFKGVYDNKSHLMKVKKDLKKHLSKL